MSMYAPVQRTMVGLLSKPRMSTYEQAVNHNIPEAVDLYRWNLDLSMALFESIHYLEVAVRNRVDEALTALAGQGDDWLDAPTTVPLNKGAKDRIATARRHAGRNRSNPTHGHVIAELTFGFWTYLFASNYNRTLWGPALKDAFPLAKREALHDGLERVMKLRNRIAHHEPLISLNIETEYGRIMEVAEMVNHRLGWWIDTTSRVDEVLRLRP